MYVMHLCHNNKIANFYDKSLKITIRNNLSPTLTMINARDREFKLNGVVKFSASLV